MYVDTKEGHGLVSFYDANVSAAPTLKSLAWLLRHPAYWPSGFVWDYKYPRTCALMIAERTWPDSTDIRSINVSGVLRVYTYVTSFDKTAASFGIRAHQAVSIFASPVLYFFWGLTTPKVVARRIERIIAKR